MRRQALISLPLMVLAFVVVWIFRPALEWLKFPTDGMFMAFTDPSTEESQGMVYTIRFLFWLALMYFALIMAKPFLSLFIPRTHGLGSTKPYRRIQALLGEVKIIFLFFITVLLCAQIPLTVQDFEQRVKDEIPNQRKAAQWNADDVKQAIWVEEKSSEEVQLAMARDRERVVPKARAAVWKEFLYNPLKFTHIDFMRIWKWAFVAALLLYGFTLHPPVRHWLAGLTDKRLSRKQQIRMGRGGSARFAGFFEEIASRFDSDTPGIFYGRSMYNPWLLIGSSDRRHMLTLGGTRAGKGVSVVQPNLMHSSGSAMVNDPKGTSVYVTAEKRRQEGQKTFVVDPFQITQETTASHSFLGHLDIYSQTIREELGIIADSQVIRNPEARDSHWDDGAKSVIAALNGYLLTPKSYKDPELPHHEHPSLYHIRELLTLPPDQQEKLWANMATIDLAGGLMREVGNRIRRGVKTEEIANILSNVDKHTSWLSSPVMHETLNEFDENGKEKPNVLRFEQLKKEATTVYLVLPPHQIDEHKRFLRLFINMALNQMAVGGKSKVPVYFLLDEFASLGPMPQIERAMGLMAGYNMTIHPILQDLGQLKKLYPKGYHTFINNSRAVQVFGTSDIATCQFVSERMGDRILDQLPLSTARGDIRKMRTPSEVSEDIAAEGNRQYILRAGKPPLLIERVPYYDSAPVPWLYRLALSLKVAPYIKWLQPVFQGYGSDPDYKS